jgi:large subunit ribosomal protein L29
MADKTAEIREMPDEELYSRVEQAKEELFNLRFQLATGQLDNPTRVRTVRHEIARTLTVLRERHLEAELEEELARVDAKALERSREAQRSGELKGTPLGELQEEALDERAEAEQALGDEAEEEEES